MDKIRDIHLHDGSGNAINSLSGALDVHSADVHIVPANRRFAQFPGTNTTTLNANASAGDTAIDIQAADYGNYDVGDWLFLEDGNMQETEFLQITVKPGSPTLTLDRPLDGPYASATTTVEEVEPNIATGNGTLAAPISFKIQPPGDEVWHITRINITSTQSAESDISEFLSLTALTNGVVIRQDNNGTKKTWTVWKSDANMMEDYYDIDPVPKPPAGNFGQRGRWWLKRSDVVIKLDGAINDFMELLIQDDLTGSTLTDFEVKALGHKEGV